MASVIEIFISYLSGIISTVGARSVVCTCRIQTSQSGTQSVSQSRRQSGRQAVSQSGRQSVGQSVSQSVSQSARKRRHVSKTRTYTVVKTRPWGEWRHGSNSEMSGVSETDIARYTWLMSRSKLHKYFTNPCIYGEDGTNKTLDTRDSEMTPPSFGRAILFAADTLTSCKTAISGQIT